MGDPSAFGFGQFVPGFDFLQNLSKAAANGAPSATPGAMPGAMPGMSSWVAPTLSIEEIDKRTQELKSVLFWLEQNTAALKATIQAMEVQKMTLTTLQSMNVNMADLAKAFTAKPPVTESASPKTDADSRVVEKASLFTPKPAPAQTVEPEPEPQAAPAASSAAAGATSVEPSAADQTAKPAVDPMQWWGALTQQFQGIAAAAMKDVAGEALKAGVALKKAKAVQPAAGRASAAGKSAPAKSSPVAGASGRGKAPAKGGTKASTKAAPAKRQSARPASAKQAKPPARKSTPK